MKTLLISLSLLTLLLACGKVPEDPGRPKRPLLPGTAAGYGSPAPPATEHERSGLFGSAPAGAPAALLRTK